jgi:hypothetical protein
MYLYKVEEYNTKKMEPLFNYIDPQLINNVISNRNNSTSYINLGHMDYDELNQIIKITEKGKQLIEKKYSQKRIL